MRVGTTVIVVILLFAGTFYLLGSVTTEYQQLLQENAQLQQQLNHSLAEVERLGGITQATQVENHVLRTQLSQQCPPAPIIQAATSAPDQSAERSLFVSSVSRLLVPIVGAFAIATLSTGGGWYYIHHRPQPPVKQRRQF